jgi:hypothetical protein
MAWALPSYTRQEINAAAKKWLSEQNTFDEYFDSLQIINNWRASHSFPLNTFQMGLRRRGRRIDPDVIVAQRIKRLSSIELKLRLRDSMKLTQMQDIGGCRAILKNVDAVRGLVESFKTSEIKHKILTEDDYIQNPKSSGYRGVHLVYSYFSDKKDTYNGLKIEVQIRSQLQHAWATAVEVVGTMIDQALKSSLGDDTWLRFFQLMSSEIARLEKTPIIPNTPDDVKQTREELAEFVVSHDPIRRLAAYRSALRYVEDRGANDHFFILKLKPKENNLTVTRFSREQSQVANEVYLTIEKSLKREEGEEAVLVSVDSVASLRKAYPNYFLDTEAFSKLVEKSIRGSVISKI